MACLFFGLKQKLSNKLKEVRNRLFVYIYIVVNIGFEFETPYVKGRFLPFK